MWQVVRTGLFCVLASATVEAGGVHLVEATGTQRFGTIQGAVDAAGEGDVVLVSAGSYAGFSITGKGVAILAAPGHAVQVTGAVRIADLPDGSTLLLSGLHVQAQIFDHAVEATQCAGKLRIQDCQFTGGDNTYSSSPVGAGLRLEACARVSIESSVLRGGGNHGGSSGAPGLYALDSSFTVHGSELRGGHGVNNDVGPSDGGPGCSCAASSTFIATDTLFRGGDAAHGCEVGPDANGGAGLVLEGSSPSALGCTFVGGRNEQATCWPGGNAPGIVGCCLQRLPGDAPAFAARAVAGDRQGLAVEIEGEPGDVVWLLASDEAAFEPAPRWSGSWLIERPMVLPAEPLGIVPASGVLATELPLPTVAPGEVVRALYLQVLARSTQGELFLGSSRALALLATHSGPDCDGDLRQDFVAVIDGPAPDANLNLVPDGCDWFGPDWHVDAGAAAGGNGAPGAPFRSLAQAFAAASSGERILAAAGVYAGVENRDLGFAGRNLEVLGQAGAASCIIDCELEGRAFLVSGGALAGGRIEGFTIRNGNGDFHTVHARVGRGGGVYVGEEVEAEIAGCVIEDCEVLEAGSDRAFGGGLYADFDSSASVVDTDFRRNRARVGGGAIYLESTALVRRCSFEENQVTTLGASIRSGGTVLVWRNATAIDQCTFLRNDGGGFGGAVSFAGLGAGPGRLSHSRLLENTAVQGGGVYFAGNPGTPIECCLIAGNRATEGGGVRAAFQAGLTLRHCTVVGNETFTPGPGVLVEGGAVQVVNCILWRNVGPGGNQLANAGATAGTLLHCFVTGGAAGISGPMNLGPGILAGDPGFVDPDGPDGDPLDFVDNDYRLGSGSNCIDAGSNAHIGPDGGDIDGDGDTAEPIPLDLDLAPRTVDDPAAPDTGSGTPPLTDLGGFERQP